MDFHRTNTWYRECTSLANCVGDIRTCVRRYLPTHLSRNLLAWGTCWCLIGENAIITVVKLNWPFQRRKQWSRYHHPVWSTCTCTCTLQECYKKLHNQDSVVYWNVITEWVTLSWYDSSWDDLVTGTAYLCICKVYIPFQSKHLAIIFNTVIQGFHHSFFIKICFSHTMGLLYAADVLVSGWAEADIIIHRLLSLS